MNALHYNILSNWFVTSSLYRWMCWVKHLCQASIFGSQKIQTWFICTLVIWIPRSTYSTLSVIFTAECGLQSIHFCQLFGICYPLTGEFWIKLKYSVYRLLKKLKKSSAFFLWAKESFSLKIVLQGIHFTVEHVACSEMQPRQRRFT